MEELPIIPRGIKFQADFVTPAHEAELIHIFRSELDWPTTKKFASRKSLHYGYTFDYKTFGIDPNIPYKPFPGWLRPLIPRTAQGGRDPDQVCLQYYPPGAGIPPHVDTHSAYDELYALSLGSAVMMQFRHTRAREDSEAKEGGVEETAEDEREMVDVDLPPRSMMEMSGDSRLHWEHGIKKRKKDVLADGTVRMRGDRWSITYRWLREGGQCECGNERLCDTAQRRIGVEREFRWKQQQPQGSIWEEKQQEGERKGEGAIEDKGVPIFREVDRTGVDHHENSNILLSPS
ncbi:hypothetical protein F5B22DRAFT_595230 [Xylaria bambusicola]|uniref:uncharacterized protein n=1 Tax=Xylaria bambusicola TaxID=326684 RepID=UPI00200748C0|nr:uncharacterized protein F5B22DRAFT_595230 [Xylaria bambusicola]KAI0521521.1 hypothetical protein F5B22DRAFT_595230 [Xylaria bambusicola]